MNEDPDVVVQGLINNDLSNNSNRLRRISRERMRIENVEGYNEMPPDVVEREQRILERNQRALEKKRAKRKEQEIAKILISMDEIQDKITKQKRESTKLRSARCKRKKRRKTIKKCKSHKKKKISRRRKK
tara:strand:- start:1008 stop:1397 length:390 start_codon:yes stop_codon:yes gene_type:complete